MISKRRVSRWIAYFGVFALLGAMMNGTLLTAVSALLLIGQYAALEFYTGYTNPPDPPDATPEP